MGVAGWPPRSQRKVVRWEVLFFSSSLYLLDNLASLCDERVSIICLAAGGDGVYIGWHRVLTENDTYLSGELVSNEQTG